MATDYKCACLTVCTLPCKNYINEKEHKILQNELKKLKKMQLKLKKIDDSLEDYIFTTKISLEDLFLSIKLLKKEEYAIREDVDELKTMLKYLKDTYFLKN
jgi:hypothetical protein